MPCNCIKKLNAELSKENLELDVKEINGRSYFYLPTKKIGSKVIAKWKKPLVRFCPRCGKDQGTV